MITPPGALLTLGQPEVRAVVLQPALDALLQPLGTLAVSHLPGLRVAAAAAATQAAAAAVRAVASGDAAATAAAAAGGAAEGTAAALSMQAAAQEDAEGAGAAEDMECDGAAPAPQDENTEEEPPSPLDAPLLAFRELVRAQHVSLEVLTNLAAVHADGGAWSAGAAAGVAAGVAVAACTAGAAAAARAHMRLNGRGG